MIALETNKHTRLVDVAYVEKDFSRAARLDYVCIHHYSFHRIGEVHTEYGAVYFQVNAGVELDLTIRQWPWLKSKLPAQPPKQHKFETPMMD